MLFEEFQDGYSMDGHLKYLGGMIKANLGLHFALKTPHQFYAQEKIWVGRCCLKNSKMAVFDLIYYKSSRCMMPPLKFLLKRIYELEEVV